MEQTQDRHARYRVVAVDRDTVVIEDVGPWDRFVTVTNDAEWVVRHLVDEGVLRPPRRLFYYDSDQCLDEILVVDGRFAGFKPAAMNKCYRVWFDDESALLVDAESAEAAATEAERLAREQSAACQLANTVECLDKGSR